MKVINVKVMPNAKRDEVSSDGERLKVRVRAPAIDGKANRAVIELLAEFYNTKKNAVRIIRGERAREKVIEIDICKNNLKSMKKMLE